MKEEIASKIENMEEEIQKKTGLLVSGWEHGVVFMTLDFFLKNSLLKDYVYR